MEHPKITPSYAFPVPPRKRVAMKILLLSYYLITGGIVWSLCSCIGILEKKLTSMALFHTAFYLGSVCTCPMLIWRRFKKILYLDPHPNTGLNQNTQLTTEFAAAQR